MTSRLKYLKKVIKSTAVFLLSVTAIAALSFFLVARLPGDAALNSMLPMGVTDTAVIENLRQSLGLDLSLPLRFINWLKGVLQLDFGQSFYYARAVSSVLADASSVTVKVCTLAAFMILILALPLGFYCALKSDGIIDKILHILAVLCLSLPTFLIGLIILSIGGAKLKIIGTLPATAYADLIIPALTLALPLVAYYIRQIRTAVLKEIDKPYICALIVRGIKLNRILVKHILPRALIALLPLAAISLARLLCGSVIVETVFSLNGLGAVALKAVTMRDINLIEAYIIYCAVIFILLNKSVDIICRRLSRYDEKGEDNV